MRIKAERQRQVDKGDMRGGGWVRSNGHDSHNDKVKGTPEEMPLFFLLLKTERCPILLQI